MKTESNYLKSWIEVTKEKKYIKISESKEYYYILNHRKPLSEMWYYET